MDTMLLLKASLLLSLTITSAWLLRDGPATVRHRLWSCAFGALVALPFLAFALPAVEVPVPSRWATWTSAGREVSGSSPSLSGRELPSRQSAVVSTSGPAIRPGSQRDASRAIEPSESPAALSRWLVAWFAGTIAATAALLLSLFRVRRLSRQAAELEDQEWRRAADTLGRILGLRRPARLLVSAEVDTPMAGGLVRPVVYLPASALSWEPEQRDVVLAHEIAHLAGKDPLRHVAARLAVAFYWFHPLAWIAARQSAVSREQACDEAVLSLGLRPSTYARVLLEMAESVQPSNALIGALPMVEPSLLEKRLMRILNGEIRPAARRPRIGIATAATLVTLAIAAARPAALPLPQAMPAAPASLLAPLARASADLTAVAVSGPVEAIASRAGVFTAAQTATDRDSACAWMPAGNRSFSGSISTSRVGGRTIVAEQIGTMGVDRVIQKSFDDLRLCMLAEGVGDRDNTDPPSEWLGRARHVVIEIHRGRAIERLEIARESANAERVSWQVGGTERAFDRSAEEWRDRVLAVLDTTWELSVLHGRVSSLQGDISSIQGEESSLRGEISSLQGEVSSMQGHISSVQGQESTLRGEISSILGHVSSLQGSISSQQGSISSLEASRYSVDAADRDRIAARIAERRAEIARIEKVITDYEAKRRIAEVERQIRALDASGKIAAMEADIRRFDLNGKVAAVERRIAELDVPAKIANIERQINALDADRRDRELQTRRENELKNLEAALARIR